jgi:uncharacterized membrane protein
MIKIPEVRDMLKKMAVILIAFAMAIFIFMPLSNAIADVGDNELDAVIVGANVFNPGTTAQVQILVQNNNTVDKVDAGAAQVGLSQSYGSAVSLTATLVKGNAPITIKADKMLLGTLPAGMATSPIPFTIEVDDNAQPGVYQVQLLLAYKTLVSTSVKQTGEASLVWSATKSQVVDLDLKIEERYIQFEITSLQLSLKPGARNEVKVIFKNDGNKTARDVVVQVSAGPPLYVTDNTSFLGTLEPGQSAVATFGVKALGDAMSKQYALDAFVTYIDANGDEQVSKKMAVPVLVDRTSSGSGVTRGQFFTGLIGAAAVVVLLLIWYFVRRVRRKKAV